MWACIIVLALLSLFVTYISTSFGTDDVEDDDSKKLAPVIFVLLGFFMVVIFLNVLINIHGTLYEKKN